LRSEPVTRALAAVLAAAIGGASGPAAAASPAPVTASFELTAAPECTTREEVAARIAARSSRIRLDAGDGVASATRLRAAIAPGTGGAIVAELTIAQPGSAASVRKLTARSCADAADAVALVIVVALDPTSLAGGAPSPPAAAPEPAPPPAPAPPPPLAVPPPAEPEVAAVAAPPPPPVPAQARFGASAVGQALFGPVPGAMLGMGVEATAALDRESIWSPALVLRATHAWKDGVMAVGGIAAFALDALALDVCPLRVHAAVLHARACGAALVGRLAATGSYTYSPRTEHLPFATLGGAIILTLDLGEHLIVSARGGLGTSQTRETFAFSPVQFHRIAAVTLDLDLGIGVRFP
jgi:hypothetical protein